MDTGDGFDVTTNMTFEQRGVQSGDLQEAIFSGGFTGMFAMGPMMMFGPASMMLPMMLGDEEIRVRSEPIRVMGFGSMHMEREVEIADLRGDPRGAGRRRRPRLRVRGGRGRAVPLLQLVRDGGRRRGDPLGARGVS